MNISKPRKGTFKFSGSVSTLTVQWLGRWWNTNGVANNSRPVYQLHHSTCHHGRTKLCSMWMGPIYIVKSKRVDNAEDDSKIISSLTADVKHWKDKYNELNHSLMCELKDPNGTIWEYARKQQDAMDKLKVEINHLRVALQNAERH